MARIDDIPSSQPQPSNDANWLAAAKRLNTCSTLFTQGLQRFIHDPGRVDNEQDMQTFAEETLRLYSAAEDINPLET